jgi:hypothetical protein
MPCRNRRTEWREPSGAVGKGGMIECHSFFVARNVLMETAAEVSQEVGREALGTAGESKRRNATP